MALTLAVTFALTTRKPDRVDRRLKRHQTGKRRVVIALRERQGRVLPFVGMFEAEGVALANENVDRMATMSADEASHWDMLHMGWHVDRVNHSEIYSDHGKHTNWWKATSPACAAWWKASTTALARNTCTSTQTTPHGWKTTAARTMARWRISWLAMRWVRPCRASGRATGSGRLKCPIY